MIHSREIATAVRDGEPPTVRPLVREAFVVPETKDLGALLREFRASREQLAVIVSEYGTTLGIITVEDILEEIVGEIENEYELPDSSIERIDEETVRVSGSITVDDFNESEGTGLPQDGPRTLAGLVFDRLGRAAEPGDRISIDGVELHVTGVEGVRITSLEVRRPRRDQWDA
ncbi:MAG: CBS domain-containing protein [Thermoleophilia bacterium]|nr:CBS domain-containing protein [Thermoleophilia bacterium]